MGRPDRTTLHGLHALPGQHAATSPTRAATRIHPPGQWHAIRTRASTIRWPNIDVLQDGASATVWCRPTTTISRRASASPGLADFEVGGPHRRRHVLQPGHRQPALRHGAQPGRPCALQPGDPGLPEPDLAERALQFHRRASRRSPRPTPSPTSTNAARPTACSTCSTCSAS